MEQIQVKHPAKFCDSMIPIFAEKLKDCKYILDPMAGTGKIALIKEFGYRGLVCCNDLEPEFTNHDYSVDVWVYADAADLWMYNENTFDGICTSPTYGNRLADHYNRKEFSKRFSYTFNLGHNLHEGNTGIMYWGKEYWDKHTQIWLECVRVLKDGGTFILNVSDFIKNGLIVPVVEWHTNVLTKWCGLNLIEDIWIDTPRMRYGQNGKARVEGEHILVFKKDIIEERIQNEVE